MFQVFVGQNRKFEVGTLIYTDAPSQSDSNLAIIIGASIGGGVLLVSLFIICCVVCCFMSRAKAKDKQFTTLLAQMELWEVEMADECKRGG